MKIAHVVTTFSPEHGGPTNEIGNYCEHQAAQGDKVSIYTLFGLPGTSGIRKLSPSVKQLTFKAWPPYSLGYSPRLVRELSRQETPDIYHVHGVWHLAQLAACREAKKRRKPYIYHMMGGFTEYELDRKRTKKRLARWLYQDQIIQGAACLHVNGETEAEFLRSLGFKPPILVLPVGVELAPSLTPAEGKEIPIRETAGNRRILLYLARLHPTKGVDLLIEAWTEINRLHPEWILVIAGAGSQEYTSFLLARSAQMISDGRIHFTGLLGDGEKQWCFSQASLYVLPSLQENFGNTVVEALSNRVPVVTTEKTPWAELPAVGCGWICAASREGIVGCLNNVLGLSTSALAEAGNKGRDLVVRKYSISASVKLLSRIYRWMEIGGSEAEEILR